MEEVYIYLPACPTSVLMAISLQAPCLLGLVLVSVCPSAGQLVGDFDKNALKASVEEQIEEEKDSKYITIGM